jgi:hypothetical protein
MDVGSRFASHVSFETDGNGYTRRKWRVGEDLMKAQICLAAFSLVIGSAIAQQGSTSNPQAPAGANPQSPQSSSTQSTQEANRQDTSKQDMNKGAGNTQTGSVAEMKTKTFKGVLMDASCAGVKSGTADSATTSSSTASSAATSSTTASSTTTPGTPNNPGTPGTPGSEMKTPSNKGAAKSDNTSSANRSAADSSSGSCGVSSSTSQFALKLDDGRTLAFDMVGNQRAQDEVQKNKKWSEAASSGKPIHAKISGVESGEKLVVSQIH